MNPSTPKFFHTPSNVSWITATILDFPDRGAPFRIMICPGARVCATLPPLLPHVETTARLGEIHDSGREAMNVHADGLPFSVHVYHDVVVSPTHHLLRGPGLPFPSGIELD